MQLINKNLGSILAGVVVITTSFYFGSLWQENQLLKSNLLNKKEIVTQPTDSGKPSPAQLDSFPKVNSDDYRRGAKNATVTLVEYSDFECPFCKRFHPTMNRIIEEFDQEVAWVYRHYPLSFHANAQKAAETAECVGKLAGQEAFWKFSDLYFEKTQSNGTGFPLSDLASLGKTAGAKQEAVQKCLDSGEMAQKVKDDIEGGRKAGVSGTPGTFIVTKDGVQELLPGALPYEQVKSAIEKYL